MKKTKFIVIALAAALVLMGVGYAAWSQSFNIKSTVSTGELFVQVKEVSTVVDVLQDNGGYLEITENSKLYTDCTISTDETVGDKETLKSINFILGDIYPGVRITSTLSFKNLGTVKVKTITAGSTHIDNYETSLWTDMKLEVNGEKIWGVGEAKFNNFVKTIRDRIDTLEPGTDEKTVIIVMELPIGSSNKTENSSVEWNADFTFEQYNK